MVATLLSANSRLPGQEDKPPCFGTVPARPAIPKCQAHIQSNVSPGLHQFSTHLFQPTVLLNGDGIERDQPSPAQLSVWHWHGSISMGQLSLPIAKLPSQTQCIPIPIMSRHSQLSLATLSFREQTRLDLQPSVNNRIPAARGRPMPELLPPALFQSLLKFQLPLRGAVHAQELLRLLCAFSQFQFRREIHQVDAIRQQNDLRMS
jgi:hypothetical protein